jgi:CheY-like chemotaxis protein
VGLATLHSTPGEGTSVRLYFAPAQDAAPAAAPPVAELPLQTGKTVLLVEDNAEVSTALRPVLESLGCNVHHAQHANAACDWLQQQPVLPDWVLSDVVMPGGMDGIALARHVRAHFPQVRVLLMSGYTAQLDAVARLGFDILPKPCSAQMLAQAFARTRERA